MHEVAIACRRLEHSSCSSCTIVYGSSLQSWSSREYIDLTLADLISFIRPTLVPAQTSIRPGSSSRTPSSNFRRMTSKASPPSNSSTVPELDVRIIRGVLLLTNDFSTPFRQRHLANQEYCGHNRKPSFELSN